MAKSLRWLAKLPIFLVKIWRKIQQNPFKKVMLWKTLYLSLTFKMNILARQMANLTSSTWSHAQFAFKIDRHGRQLVAVSGVCPINLASYLWCMLPMSYSFSSEPTYSASTPKLRSKIIPCIRPISGGIFGLVSVNLTDFYQHRHRHRLHHSSNLRWHWWQRWQTWQGQVRFFVFSWLPPISKNLNASHHIKIMAQNHQKTVRTYQHHNVIM